jgi:hypothetical protein
MVCFGVQSAKLSQYSFEGRCDSCEENSIFYVSVYEKATRVAHQRFTELSMGWIWVQFRRNFMGWVGLGLVN